MSLSDLIEAQNPWWADPADRPHPPPHRRTVFSRLMSAMQQNNPQRAHVLLGPRQVGKTTLLKQIARQFLDDGWPGSNVLYFDFKDDRYDHRYGIRDVLSAKPPGLRATHPRLILLDEVTQSSRWDETLKQLVDEARSSPGTARAHILVTDSAAAIMQRGATDSLQGRIDQTLLHGLSFLEALRIQSTDREDEQDVFLRSPGILERYLKRGGLPEHVTSDRAERAWEQIRRDTIDGAIARDLSRETNIDIERVATLFRHIVLESGGLFEASSRARDLKLRGERGPDPRTVRKWVGLLERACLVEGLDPWHRGSRSGTKLASRALKATRKVYASDHGFLPAFSPMASPMTNSAVRGKVFETVVFTHLRSLREERGDFNLYYFREKEKAEIDFVLAFANVVIGIEVTSRKSPDKKIAGVKTMIERAGLDRILIVHGGPSKPQDSNLFGTCPLDAFLLDPSTRINEAVKCAQRSL